MLKHKTISIIEVDEVIEPLIQWLNKFTGITTLNSCQGTKEQLPYVMFTCSNLITLRYILSRLNRYINSCTSLGNNIASAEVQLFNDQLSFCIRFHCQELPSSMILETIPIF